MRKFLLTVSRVAFLEVALSPVLLCGAIAASDMGRYYHNLVVLTVVCAITFVVSYVASQVID